MMLGAVKNIIPAVASTNAVIAAACVNEALKCLTFSGQLCNTYMLYNGQSVGSGVDCNTLIFEKLQECPACGQPPAVEVKVSSSITVKEFVEYLKVNGWCSLISCALPIQTAESLIDRVFRFGVSQARHTPHLRLGGGCFLRHNRTIGSYEGRQPSTATHRFCG